MTESSRVMSEHPAGATPPARSRLGTTLAAWVVPMAIFLSTFGVYAATAESETITNDAYAASVGAWRIASTGAPWLEGVDMVGFGGENNEARVRWFREAPNGHVVTQRAAGPIAVGVPFYWLLGQSDASEEFDLIVGGYAASFVTALAVMLMYLALRRRASQPLAITAALVLAFATPTWSVSANGLWTHPVTQLGIAGAAYALSRERWWLAGLFLGLGLWGRQHLAVVAAVVGLGMAWSRRDWRLAVQVGLPASLSLAMLVGWNRLHFGEWSIGGAYGDDRVTSAAAGYGGSLADQLLNYLGFLVSPDRGFLVWTPLVLIMLPAVVRAWRGLPAWSIWLLVGGVVYTFFQLRLNYFAGGSGFYAYRHGLELVTCLTPAFVLAVPSMGRVARRVAPVVIALQVGAIGFGAAVTGYYVHIAYVWTDNSLWLALRHETLAVGIWLALWLALGVGMSLVLNRPRPVQPAAVSR